MIVNIWLLRCIERFSVERNFGAYLPRKVVQSANFPYSPEFDSEGCNKRSKVNKLAPILSRMLPESQDGFSQAGFRKGTIIVKINTGNQIINMIRKCNSFAARGTFVAGSCVSARRESYDSDPLKFTSVQYIVI